MTDAIPIHPLPARIDLSAIEPLRSQFLNLRGRDLVVDASRVEHISGLGFQVLLSAKRTWALDGRSLEIVNPSPAFTSAQRHTGIDIERANA